MRTPLTKWLSSTLLLTFLAVASFGAARLVASLSPPPLLAPATADEAPATLEVRQADVNGLDAGELLAGERSLLTIAIPAGGLTGYERAQIVAGRLNQRLAAGAEARDFSQVVEGDLGQFVYRQETVILSVTADDARHANTTVADLTSQWAEALWSVIPGERVTAPPTTTPQTSGWQPSEPYTDKFVPIVSLLRGVRVGMARVNGPRSQVDKTQAVAQLELKFRNFLDIEVYIPISTREPGRSLTRIQGVGVTGLGDIRL